eukprot:CAMPEP_0176231874 /NCGR_PEP_ID=MMETSP0121_2-20121125/25023_1 /TAXON_ID=160619 /ORGANISM="Kryptoperidinium foliaceum, Strain CCMP 1326" /LENGTH=85 /DNA_ID=CAMNT_0017571229 /DNA_START=10 /DNA_END=267 /DNA_ORIENTATION=-
MSSDCHSQYWPQSQVHTMCTLSESATICCRRFDAWTAGETICIALTASSTSPVHSPSSTSRACAHKTAAAAKARSARSNDMTSYH